MVEMGTQNVQTEYPVTYRNSSILETCMCTVCSPTNTKLTNGGHGRDGGVVLLLSSSRPFCQSVNATVRFTQHEKAICRPTIPRVTLANRQSQNLVRNIFFCCPHLTPVGPFSTEPRVPVTILPCRSTGSN
jgi:hypothetical protein